MNGTTRKLIALFSAVAVTVLSAGIASADSLSADSDALAAGLQNGNPATVSLAPSATHTFTVAVQVKQHGNDRVTFPVNVGISTNSSFLSTPSPTSGAVTGYGDAGPLVTSVTATAPNAAALACGVANVLSGKVQFLATNNTEVLGNTGKAAEIVLKISVPGPACPPVTISDTTAPVISGMPAAATVEATGPSGATHSWTAPTATDETDGPVAVTCNPASGSTFGFGSTTVTCSAADAAGNPASSTFIVTVSDTVAPTASASVSPATPNGTNGWYKTAPTVSFSCADSGSGVASCPAAQTLGDGASQTGSGKATDVAGNESTAASWGPVSVDTQGPTNISFSGISAGDYYFGGVPTASCSADDATSGMANCTVSGRGTTIGTHTLTATATDNAGNTSTSTLSYEVKAWTLNGFYRPVDMGGVLNTVKGGSTVPLKFNVFAGSEELTDIAVVDTFKFGEIACAALSGTPTDAIEVVSTGGTSLRYDSSGGQFVQNWKTPTTAGKCYKVELKSDDGTSIAALFKITK